LIPKLVSRAIHPYHKCMSDQELLEDTNRLLRQLVEIDAQHRQDAEQSKAKLDEINKDLENKRKERLRKFAAEKGLPAEVAEGEEEDWQKRLEETRRRSKENIELGKAKELEFREQLLAELRKQSELLQKIEARLSR